MSQQGNELQAEQQSWKTRVYLIGGAVGSIIGLLSAYLFSRTAEENLDRKPAAIPTTQLLGLGLAVLGVIRQIAELGKDKKK